MEVLFMFALVLAAFTALCSLYCFDIWQVIRQGLKSKATMSHYVLIWLLPERDPETLISFPF